MVLRRQITLFKIILFCCFLLEVGELVVGTRASRPLALTMKLNFVALGTEGCPRHWIVKLVRVNIPVVQICMIVQHKLQSFLYNRPPVFEVGAQELSAYDAPLNEQFLQFSVLGFVSLGPFHCA